MSLMNSQDCQSFSRSIRKIKVATINLSNGLQSRTKEHKGKKDTICSSYLPDCIIPEEKVKVTDRSKILVKPCHTTVNNQVSEDFKIKNGTVEKDMTKDCEEDHHLVSCIKQKIHIHQAAPVGQKEQKMWSGCSNLNAEDSGLEEDASQSDNDQTDVKKNKPINRPKEELRHSVNLQAAGAKICRRACGGAKTFSEDFDYNHAMAMRLHKGDVGYGHPKIKVTTIGDLRNKWQKFAEEHVEGQKLNPFSEDFDYNHAMAMRLHKGDVGYGHPKVGSKTAERAERAKKHIYREMEEMCHIIRIMGQRNKNGHTCVTFGRLFDHYAKISDKVVGILLRCRKYKMVDFEGEMLWQGQDDDVQIRLLV